MTIDNDQAEAAFWQFDARRKGYGEWKGRPESERDAFKHTVSALSAENERRRARIERLRGLCKTLLGMLVDRDIDPAERDRLHDLIGDMEPPAELRSGRAGGET